MNYRTFILTYLDKNDNARFAVPNEALFLEALNACGESYEKIAQFIIDYYTELEAQPETPTHHNDSKNAIFSSVSNAIDHYIDDDVKTDINARAKIRDWVTKHVNSGAIQIKPDSKYISDDDAKHIGDNPDGVDVDELVAWLLWFSHVGERYAADLFGTTAPHVQQLQRYITSSNASRRWRLEGKIALAQNEQQNAETIYKFLPKNLKW